MRLLALLTELEALHQSGKIDEQVYRQLWARNRASLKQVLVQLEEGQL